MTPTITQSSLEPRIIRCFGLNRTWLLENASKYGRVFECDGLPYASLVVANGRKVKRVVRRLAIKWALTSCTIPR